MNHVHPQTVQITTKNTASLTMGIISIVIGVLALLVGWMPFLGLVAIPAAIIGLLLAGIGVILALVKKAQGIGLPLLGGMICFGAFLLPILLTGGTSAAVAKAIEESGKPAVSATASSDSNPAPLTPPAPSKAELEKAEKTAYIQKIELYDVDVKYQDSMFDGKVSGVTFKLKNTGDRSLDNVEVTIYFKDKDGQIISEKEFNPVLVSEYSTRDNVPLKPGYVWQMEAGKFYAAKSVPAEWMEGAYDIKITDIRFSK